ncbi:MULTISPECIES: hypothetical protein [unclassified Ketobacter]|uniref:hypothetical protein n=1 Tax=unclassified Ketobacter TaxID=2639109 RepID=UPI000F1128A6|nr:MULTISPECIES: hypothetical protein [unclassified Ketobacter]RLT91526.1 MAG: hypothetical protein D9N13_04110 [Ketobacter sp. GenoA1]RLT96194.1 MAG: hypothetical protein D9N15_12110 [Ketobacter sp.]
MRLSIVLFVFLILGACASQPGPAPMRIGNEVAFEMLQDQYSNPFPHEDNMQVLLFTDDMQASRDVRDAMGRVAPDCYEQGRLVFVANVSGMPRLITRLIALPKMRGYGFPVWLDYEGEATAALPVQEDYVSVIHVEKGTIARIDYVRGMESVMNVIVPLCGLKAEQLALLF